MHGKLWVNDPDCLILREEVPLPEAHALATVAAMCAGSLIFSDALEQIPAERLAILKVLLPPLPHAAQHVELLAETIPGAVVATLTSTSGLDNWWLSALFHWTSGSECLQPELKMPVDGVREWHVFEFWSRRYLRHSLGSALPDCLQPRSCFLFAVRQVAITAQFIGSDIHISCGLEVHEWQVTDRQVRLCLQVARSLPEATIWVYLPGSSQECRPCLAGSEGEDEIFPEVWTLRLPYISADGGTFVITW